MQAWLYQMSSDYYNPNEYRVEVWEGRPIVWSVGKVVARGLGEVLLGDSLVLFYAKSRNLYPGIYGWGVIARYSQRRSEIEFQPTFPSDYLKMYPLWDKKVEKLINGVRGRMTQATLWGLKLEEYRLVCELINERID